MPLPTQSQLDYAADLGIDAALARNMDRKQLALLIQAESVKKGQVDREKIIHNKGLIVGSRVRLNPSGEQLIDDRVTQITKDARILLEKTRGAHNPSSIFTYPADEQS